MKIVGVAGPDGSGKDTVADVCVEHGWMYVSVSDIMRQEIQKRNQSVTRENLRNLSAEWRREHGMGVLVEMAIKQYSIMSNFREYGGLVVASLRHPAEADSIHEHDGTMVWVEADQDIRYQRIVARKRGKEDKVSFRQFKKEEAYQMKHSVDEATNSIGEVKAKADIILENNGSDIGSFKLQVEEVLGL